MRRVLDRVQHRRLDAAQAVFLSHATSADPQGALVLVDAARREAERLVGLGPGLAEVTFAATALASLTAERHIAAKDVAAAVDELGARADADLLAVGLRALGHPELLLLPLEDFLEVTLAMLGALAPVCMASVWGRGDRAGPRLLEWGSATPFDGTLALVASVFAGEEVVADREWTAVMVRSLARPRAAMVFSVDAGGKQRAVALATSLAHLMGRAFERAALHARAAEHVSVLERSSERRVTRVGLDLHDGPLQDIALLSTELADLRAAVGAPGPDAPPHEALLERMDDLTALVDHLDDDLRVVANSLYTTGEARRPFGQSLQDIVRAFGVRTGIEPRVDVEGDLDGLSDSLRGALLRIVQECLGNVRDHSGAQNVHIVVTSDVTHVHASVEDDGVGFDVDAALLEFARHGRMGLIGIVERVRLLGGLCDIRSSPGEGCRVSLTVARWTLQMAAMAAEDVKQH